MGEGRRRREFPEEFEREAVERVRTSGMTIIAVADELGLHETVLRRWVQKVRRAGDDDATAALDDPCAAGLVAGGPRGRERPAEARERPALDGARHASRKAALI